jgi:hypothetical protein
LNDSGPGSLRAALTASGPRIVIFEVSGTISLLTEVFIRNPNLTVAGQTAPSPGVTVRNRSIYIDTSDVVLQHLRLRMGDIGCVNDCATGGSDALIIRETAYNIVLDHLSISWATHGNLGIGKWTGCCDPTEIAVLDTIISEGLTKKLTPGGVGITSMASKNGTWTHARNLHAHQGNRMPWVGVGWRFSGYNNVAYNAGNVGGSLDQGGWGFLQVVGGYNTPYPFDVAWISNVAIAGPNTHPDGRAVKVGNFTPLEASLPNKLYLADNVGPHQTRENQWGGVTYWNGIQGGIASEVGVRSSVVPGWHTAFNYQILPSDRVLPYVLANAGARPLDRDAVDKRIVADVRAGTGSRITSPTAVGGFPVLAQNYRALTPPSDPHAVGDAAGRTRIEVWLEAFARALEPARQTTLSAPQNLRAQ